MKHEFHPEAEQELLEEAERYESEVPGLGLRFGDEVHRVIELLLENPEAGSPLDPPLRYFVLRRFPHAIIYAVLKDVDALLIVAVAHGSRKPGYWRDRSSG
ncbi:MAG: type II toxin-antitoxin system RelE/ParE family toxin [Gammaproteobacteria bacterium]|nr:type II toxin-antitoxin system RelE/ParE family toxin [Gammaproteobacteria bacterium]